MELSTGSRGIRAARRLAGVEPYASPKPQHPIDLWLDSNEGAAPPVELLHRVREAADNLRRYPSSAGLEALVANQFGVSGDRALVTAGADDAICRACMALLDQERDMILPVPTFEMLARYAHLAGGRVVKTPWMSGPYPTDAVLDAITSRTALIAVVSPNNPTGAVASEEDIRRLSLAAPHAMLLIDLAYAEFTRNDLTATALGLSNAIIVRTFSKAWGLAGLRVGYALGSPEVIRWMQSVGSPYAVSRLSAALAQEWLMAGRREVAQFVARVRQERAALVSLLGSLGAEPLESEANFVLARFADAERVWDGLARRGIAVRRFPAHPQLTDHLRITCPGEPPAFERLTDALRKTQAEIARSRP